MTDRREVALAEIERRIVDLPAAYVESLCTLDRAWILAVLRADKDTLERHALVERQTRRIYVDGVGVGGGIERTCSYCYQRVGGTVRWPCPDALPRLDIYGPEAP